jgi:DNA invertase Pin-like site-specific DNA recombinase
MNNCKNGMFGIASEDNPCAKLILKQAIEIREEYKTGLISTSKLSKKYNVSKKTILNILHNKIYKEDLGNE